VHEGPPVAELHAEPAGGPPPGIREVRPGPPPRLLSRPRPPRARGHARLRRGGDTSAHRDRDRLRAARSVGARRPPAGGRVPPPVLPLSRERLPADREGRRPRPPEGSPQGRVGVGLPSRLRGVPSLAVPRRPRPPRRSRGGNPPRRGDLAGRARGWEAGAQRDRALPLVPGVGVRGDLPRGGDCGGLSGSWWARKDSNLRLAGYEPAVLTS